MLLCQDEPFLAHRIEYMLAQLCAILVNIHRDPKKSSPKRIADFLLFSGRERREQQKLTDPDLVKAAFVALQKGMQHGNHG